MTDSNQRKKLPACDYCKSKRVLCHPQQIGSCPRCLEKGVICKTTPVIRQKRRTKVQQQSQSYAFGRHKSSEAVASSDTHSRNSSIEVSSTRRVSPSQQLSLSCNDLGLPPSLVKALFQDFRFLPHFNHPIITLCINTIESSLNRCSWHLPSLPSQLRVLAQCIIAITARISGNVHIIGPAHDIPDISAQAQAALKISLDCGQFGQRRNTICEQLRAEAVWLAQHEGVMITPCAYNAASLELLEFLEYRNSGKGGNAYSAAYIHHLRRMSDEVPSLDLATQTKHSAFLMKTALSSMTTGNVIPFTYHDELLLCGEDPCSLEDILSILSSESSTPTPLHSVMRPLTFHMTRLSRKISESLTGPYARRQPLNEAKLVCQLNELDLLHACVVAGANQMERLRFDISEEIFQYIQLCAYPLVHGWGALCLVLFEELKRRRELIRVSLLEESTDGSMLRMQARVDLLYAQVRAITSKAALQIAGSLQEVPSLSRITHSTFSDLHKWARFLLEDADVDLAQRVEALELLRGGLNIVGFSWVDRTGTVETIDQYIASSRWMQQITDLTTSIQWLPGGAEGDFMAWIQASSG